MKEIYRFYFMKEIYRSLNKIYISLTILCTIVAHHDQSFQIKIVQNNDTCEYHFFKNIVTLHRLYQTDFNFSSSSSHYVEITTRFTRFIRPIVHQERHRSKTEVQQKNDTRAISRIGETETSSPSISFSDSTEIYYQYEKIVGLIISPKALKKYRHASHLCQHVTI